MKIIKKLILCFLPFVIIYLGIFNKIFPFVLFFTYLTWAALQYCWVFRPLTNGKKLMERLQNVNYFKGGIIINMMLFTFVNTMCVFYIKIGTDNPLLINSFLILKILISIFFELLYLIILINDEQPFPI